MRNVFIILALSLGFIACGSSNKNDPSAVQTKEEPALTVYFPPLLSWMPFGERQKLWAFRDMDEKTGYWHITGHSDKYGSAEFKEEISMARARAVEKYLRETYGYDVVGIIQGKSDKEPRSDSDQALNRRAEVMFVKYEIGKGL